MEKRKAVWSILLLTIVTLDAIITLLLVRAGLATEANPLLRPLIPYPVTLIVVKLAPVLLLGLYASWRQIQLAFYLYCSLYGIGTIIANVV